MEGQISIQHQRIFYFMQRHCCEIDAHMFLHIFVQVGFVIAKYCSKQYLMYLYSYLLLQNTTFMNHVGLTSLYEAGISQ